MSLLKFNCVPIINGIFTIRYFNQQKKLDFNQISINKNDSLEDLDFKICLNCLNFHILGFGSSAVRGKYFWYR